jgi:hypothetical protein
MQDNCPGASAQEPTTQPQDGRKPRSGKHHKRSLESIYEVFDSIQPDERGCLHWPRPKTLGNYTVVKIDGRLQRVHRLALQRKLGRAIHPGLCALHTCDCKSCVNPEHLREGTQSDNARDAHKRNPTFLAHKKRIAWASTSAGSAEIRRLRTTHHGSIRSKSGFPFWYESLSAAATSPASKC